MKNYDSAKFTGVSGTEDRVDKRQKAQANLQTSPKMCSSESTVNCDVKSICNGGVVR